MLYADANIIIRYIVNDDDEMAGKAESAINSRIQHYHGESNSFL